MGELFKLWPRKIGVATLLLVCVFSVWVIPQWYEIQIASTEFESLGGTIHDDADLLFGPVSVGFGTAPGQRTDKEMRKVINALVRVCRLPLVRRVSLARQPFSAVELHELLRTITIKEFHCEEMLFDDQCIEILLNNPTFECLELNRCPVTLQGLLQCQNHKNIRRIAVIHLSLNDLELATLKEAFGDRIWIWEVDETSLLKKPVNDQSANPI